MPEHQLPVALPTQNPATTTSTDTISPPTVTIGEWRYVRWDEHEATIGHLTQARQESNQFKERLQVFRADSEAHETSRREELINALREAGHESSSIDEILQSAGFEGMRKPFRLTVRVPVYVELEIDVDAVDEEMAKESVTVDGADDLERQAMEVLRHGGGEVVHDEVKVLYPIELLRS